jgi:uncharacterized protein YkwD
MKTDTKRLYGLILLICIVLSLLTASVTAATTGTISVSSSPSRATILLDSSSTGKTTSATLKNVPAGTHTITLKLSGYQDLSKTVQVRAGHTSTLTGLKLVKIPTPTPTPRPLPTATSTPRPSPTSTPTVIPTTPVTPVPGESQISRVEQAIFKYTNIERQNNGKAPLIWDTKLASAARSHSEDMAKNRFFSHTSYDGRSPGQRLNALGFYAWGENIAATGFYTLNSDPDAVGKGIVQMWMNSDGHRANILGDSINFNRIGVGVAYSSQYYGYLATQDFARV